MKVSPTKELCIGGLLAPLGMTADVIPLGPRIKCGNCQKPMVRNANGFECRRPDCGKGYLRAKGGMKITQRDGVTILESKD